MPYYRRVGDVPRKRHIRFERPGGGLHSEELMGVEGFSADSALLYHRQPPTAIVKAESVDEAPAAVEVTANRPLLPRHLRTHALPSGGDMATGRRLLLANDDVRLLHEARRDRDGRGGVQPERACVFGAIDHGRDGDLELAENGLIAVEVRYTHEAVRAGRDHDHVLAGVVDDYFPRVLGQRLRCWIVNGRHPERVAQLVETGRTVGTEVV